MSESIQLTMEMNSHQDILRDCLDHGDDVGPPARNVKIWDMLIKDFKECFDDCSKKIPMGVLKNIMKLLIMLKKEYIKLYGETSCGIAVLDFSFGLVVSALILFHNGEILYLQVQKKKQVESEWKEAVCKTRLYLHINNIPLLLFLGTLTLYPSLVYILKDTYHILLNNLCFFQGVSGNLPIYKVLQF